MTAPVHLQPSTELADRVLLPGDPGRALRLAQALLETPRMFNHNRGLWGYTGEASDGRLLSIQSTGMGGPSVGIVVSELIDLGAQQLIRVGTCGGLREDLELGQLLVAGEAISDDGASRALGAGPRIRASERLSAALIGTGLAQSEGPVVSTDLFYGAEAREPGWRRAGALAVEMEAAALFKLGARRGVETGCALVVTDLLFGDRRRIDPEELEAAELRMGELAVAGLRSLAGT